MKQDTWKELSLNSKRSILKNILEENEVNGNVLEENYHNIMGKTQTQKINLEENYTDDKILNENEINNNILEENNPYIIGKNTTADNIITLDIIDKVIDGNYSFASFKTDIRKNLTLAIELLMQEIFSRVMERQDYYNYIQVNKKYNI